MPSEMMVTGKASSDIENVDWSTGTASGPHYQNVVRFGSSSSQASQSSGDICRICHCESDPQNPLLTPCYCSGTLKYVHQACLQQWLTASATNACELCKFPFIMHTKIKPFNEWRSLEMSGVERRRLCCAVLFHCAAALCVIWSLCVLIERAAEEVKRGLIGWPFWTKLAVVTVGLTGGVVFMYIQCRQYLHLCHRWRARNRILLIQNAPEKVHPLSPPSPVMTRCHMPRNNSATAASAMTTNSCNYSTYGCTSAGNRSSSGMMNPSNNPHVPQHGQIVANIENNSQNYDRDWTLDDVSQISSFRPCPQGSGSMTPFHDSVHNALENSLSCSNSISDSPQDLSNLMPNSSNCSNRSNDLDMFKTSSVATAGAIAAASTASKYPNSSVFLENSDILNDAGYPKINYRHSSVLMSPEITDNLDKFLGKDMRRYSDTKLLSNDSDVLSPIFNVALRSGGGEEFRTRQSAYSKAKSGKGGNSDCLVHNLLGAPQITDIIFESTNQFDPMELNNIHEMLEMDGYQPRGPKKSRHSLNNVEAGIVEVDEKFDRSRLFFKSLPNLSSSCESLIKK